MASRAIRWTSVEFYAHGMRFKAMADYTVDRHDRVDLHAIKVTHINAQPIVHGWDLQIDPTELSGDEWDAITAQIRTPEPPDEDCVTESRRLALAECVNS